MLDHGKRFGRSAPNPVQGCFGAGDKSGQLFEDPVSLNAGQLIPQLQKAGVTALKIEGRQRSRSPRSKPVG